MDAFGEDDFLGMEPSKSLGRAKEFGQYKYFKRTDGSLYVLVSGAETRRYELGKLSNKNSPISIVARAIADNFNIGEFSKKRLIPLIPKSLRYGQKIKAILDVMTLIGHLEKRETKPEGKGRLQELFNAKVQLKRALLTSSLEQT